MNLDQQQQRAMHHVHGPALVLAGPGSGKTTVLMSRLAYLISEVGISPQSILSMTFNKAAQLEMEERCNQFLKEKDWHKIRFSTLHSFCNGVVKDYEIRQRRTLVRIEGNDRGAGSKQDILKHIYKETNKASISNDELEELMNEISVAKNKMLKDFEQHPYRTKNFPSIYKAYDQYKKTKLLIDFDDMLTYAYHILLKCPDMLTAYRRQYPYIQVDEGQDLSGIQFEIVKLLAGPCNNLFIVADDDQSIYGFRGAEPDYILTIEKDFPNCALYYLEQNYRSTRNIVELSSKLIKYNLKRFDKNHRTSRDHKRDPVVIQAKDEYEQLKCIVKTIKKMTRKKAEDIAILYRNNLSSVAIADMLLGNDIPFSIKQNKVCFFRHWFVQDMVAFLKFALDQKDTDAFTRICFKMNRFLSKEMVEHALCSAYRLSVIDGILTYHGLQPFQKQKIGDIKREFRRMSKMSPVKALRYIEEAFCYFEAVKEYRHSPGVSAEYLYNLFGILKTIARGCSSIVAFLGRLAALEDIFRHGQSASCGPGITLSTLHASKGLEYDCVLMVDLINEEFPGIRCIEDMNNGEGTMLEEERRLFYVGMTRAKEYLYLISPKTKNNRAMSRSQFIDEVLASKKG